MQSRTNTARKAPLSTEIQRKGARTISFFSLFLRKPKKLNKDDTIPYAKTFNPKRSQTQPFALAPPFPLSLSIALLSKKQYGDMYGEGESEEKSWWR